MSHSLSEEAILSVEESLGIENPPPDFEQEQQPENPEEPPLEIYYDSERKEYLVQNGGGRWLAQTQGQTHRRLKHAGVEERSKRERILQDIEDFYDVRYAAPLAGRKAGFYEENGIRFLVTESPTFIEPSRGDWSVLRALIEGLLVKGEPEHGIHQWNTFMGWLQTAVNALRTGSSQDSQALAIAGQRDCGKSLLQHLLTLMLGGRSAKGARYMMGKTEFNAELFEAEHIMLEDEFMSHRMTDRLKLGTAIKNFTVSTQVQDCHRKGRTAVNLSPSWWVSITLNDDAEALQVLPPLDDHIEDKIILLRALRFQMPMETNTTELRAKFQARLRNEIPAFLHWLINEFRLEKSYEDRRFVVKSWHHPTIRAELAELAPESRLLILADEVLWDDLNDQTWLGTADQLRRKLLNHVSAGSDAKALLNWSNATGTYLSRLAKDHPNRVERANTNRAKRWKLHRPENLGDC